VPRAAASSAASVVGSGASARGDAGRQKAGIRSFDKDGPVSSAASDVGGGSSAGGGDGESGDNPSQNKVELAYPSIKIQDILLGANLGRSVKGVISTKKLVVESSHNF
jgi:hypothetical protein